LREQRMRRDGDEDGKMVKIINKKKV